MKRWSIGMRRLMPGLLGALLAAADAQRRDALARKELAAVIASHCLELEHARGGR